MSIVGFPGIFGSIVARAATFAAVAHGKAGQVRKYTGAAYIEHPAAVAKLVESVGGSPEQVAAAWLHDVVEDTPVTIEEVAAEFGDVVAGLVSSLTDVSKPSDGNRKARKAIDLRHTAEASPEAKTVKLADLIDNTRSIVEHDPAFARIYLAEKLRLLEVLGDGDPVLFALAKAEAEAGLSKLAGKGSPEVAGAA